MNKSQALRAIQDLNALRGHSLAAVGGRRFADTKIHLNPNGLLLALSLKDHPHGDSFLSQDFRIEMIRADDLVQFDVYSSGGVVPMSPRDRAKTFATFDAYKMLMELEPGFGGLQMSVVFLGTSNGIITSMKQTNLNAELTSELIKAVTLPEDKFRHFKKDNGEFSQYDYDNRTMDFIGVQVVQKLSI